LELKDGNQIKFILKTEDYLRSKIK